MLNTLKGLKACHNTVKHLASFFGCTRDFAGMYLQMATAEEAIEFNNLRRNIDWSIN